MSIRDWIEEIHPDETVLLADGFDDALIGVGRIFNGPPIAVYDSDLCIAELQKKGMSREDAEDWFSYNVISSYIGEQTPMFMERPPKENK